jgi:hypothetical protein
VLSRQVRQYLCLILTEYILWCQFESSPQSLSIPLRFLVTSFCIRVGHTSASSLQTCQMKVSFSRVLNNAIYLLLLTILDLIILLLNADRLTAYKYGDCWKYL